MSFPSIPSNGDTAYLNNHLFEFDSDLNRWLLLRSASDEIIYNDIDSEVDNLKSLIFQNASSAGHPVGSVMAFSSANMPAGFLYADGSTFNELIYPQLYEFLGNSNVLPNLVNRTLAFKVLDQMDSEIYPDVHFGVAGYDGAGVTYDSDLISSIMQQSLADRDSEINSLKSRVTELEGDLAQAISDRVYTDNQLSSRIDDNDSDIAQKGRFYVQSTAPSGGPNSGWVNTTNMKLHVWDNDTWIEVVTT